MNVTVFLIKFNDALGPNLSNENFFAFSSNLCFCQETSTGNIFKPDIVNLKCECFGDTIGEVNLWEEYGAGEREVSCEGTNTSPKRKMYDRVYSGTGGRRLSVLCLVLSFKRSGQFV